MKLGEIHSLSLIGKQHGIVHCAMTSSPLSLMVRLTSSLTTSEVVSCTLSYTKTSIHGMTQSMM